MNGYNFTERVRKVLALAREESVARRHEYVGTEHLLLAVVREGQGVAAQVLMNLDVDLETLKQQVDGAITVGDAGRPTGPDLPYTSRAKKVLELAMASARDHAHSYVGTEHLLLGMIREERGVAAQTLLHAGVTYDAASRELLRLLDSNPPSAARPERQGTITLITIEQRMEDGSLIRNEFRSAAAARAFLAEH